jgi:hypothetical protein
MLRYELNKTFLENPRAPLGMQKKIKATKKMNTRFAKQILLIFKRGEIIKAIQLFRQFNLPLSAYIKGFSSILMSR